MIMPIAKLGPHCYFVGHWEDENANGRRFNKHAQ